MVTSTETEKFVRRDILALWNGEPYSPHPKGVQEREKNLAECDRIMIALHRFQTDGKVAYRRLIGMHGGGGGMSCAKFKEILDTKVNLDLKTHYSGQFPDGGFWPNPSPNAAPPVEVKKSNQNRCFAYTFCWHRREEFLVWHRAFMAEFERCLQEYDPKFIGETDKSGQHKGPGALGAPYWSWEGWDGNSLPQVISNDFYSIKTSAWSSVGYPAGFVFANPFKRWFAPVSIEDQVSEKFPAALSDANSTTRSSAFTDQGARFAFPWPIVNVKGNPSMERVVDVAIANPTWKTFCTTKNGKQWSIENPHNKFHNRIGGATYGGTQGPGLQEFVYPNGTTHFKGTMTQNQSSFDPLFFLHHANVERQFDSWKKQWYKDGEPLKEESKPSDEIMKTVLYPWTKPNLLFNGNLSWNTPASTQNDATFGDWFSCEVPYEYDNYVVPFSVPVKKAAPTSSQVNASHHTGVPRGIQFAPETAPVPIDESGGVSVNAIISNKNFWSGEYTLLFDDELVATIGVLTANGGACGACSNSDQVAISFDVSETFETVEDVNKAIQEGRVELSHLEQKIDVIRFEATD